MISKQHLKEICPITLKELGIICWESPKTICLGWLREYLRTGEFTLTNGLIEHRSIK